MKIFKGLKRKTAILLAAILAIISAVVFAVSAFAIWDGQSTSGGSAEDATGDFYLPYADERCVVGYRISFYNQDGLKKGHSIDLYRATTVGGWTAYGTGSGRNNAHNDKIEIYRKYINGQSLNLTMTTNLTTGYDFLDSNIGVDELSYVPSSMDTWTRNIDNINEIVLKCGTTYSNTDRVIIEPLITGQCGSDGRLILTVAEWALYQKATVGLDGYPSMEAGHFGYISWKLLGNFPTYLYTENDYWGCEAISASDITIKNGGYHYMGPNAYGSRNTARDILEHMVGVGVYYNLASAQTNNTLTVRLHTNGATYYAENGVEQELSDSDKIIRKITYEGNAEVDGPSVAPVYTSSEGSIYLKRDYYHGYNEWRKNPEGTGSSVTPTNLTGVKTGVQIATALGVDITVTGAIGFAEQRLPEMVAVRNTNNFPDDNILTYWI